MEQLVPIGDLQEIWIEGTDPDSLVRAFLAAMAAEQLTHPGAALLDFQIQGGAGGSQYRVALPCSATATPLILPGVPVVAARVSFAVAQGRCELDRVTAALIASIVASHSGAVVRFVQFHSANGDGAHLVGIVWAEEYSPPTVLGLRVTRMWNCPACPDSDLEVAPAADTIIQSQIIPCNVQQLGRAYLVWWNLCLREPREAEYPGQGPVVLQGTIIEHGSGAFGVHQDNAIENKVQFITGDGNDFPYLFHWVTDGCGQCFVKPGITGPLFTVAGPNSIDLVLRNQDDTIDATAIAHESSFTIVEVEGDISLLQTVAANQP